MAQADKAGGRGGGWMGGGVGHPGPGMQKTCSKESTMQNRQSFKRLKGGRGHPLGVLTVREGARRGRGGGGKGGGGFTYWAALLGTWGAKKAGKWGRGEGGGQTSSRAATPGRTLPSSSSREAPPPVEMWLILSARPAFSTAATESPPPMIVIAPCSNPQPTLSTPH